MHHCAEDEEIEIAKTFFAWKPIWVLFKTSFQNMSDGVRELSRIKGAGWLCTKPINGWIKCGQNTLKVRESQKQSMVSSILTKTNKKRKQIDLIFSFV